VTLHQLNPPKPDISVTKVGPSSGSQNVPNGYNLVLGSAKQGWHWPGDTISFEVSEQPSPAWVDGRPRDAGAGDPDRRDRQLHLAHDDHRADHRQGLVVRGLERQRWRDVSLNAHLRR
jgi:hypothetical protein